MSKLTMAAFPYCAGMVVAVAVLLEPSTIDPFEACGIDIVNVLLEADSAAAADFPLAIMFPTSAIMMNAQKSWTPRRSRLNALDGILICDENMAKKRASGEESKNYGRCRNDDVYRANVLVSEYEFWSKRFQVK